MPLDSALRIPTGLPVPAPLRRRVRAWRCLTYEARNKILGAPAALRNRRLQHDEIARLRATLAEPIRARTLVVIPTYRRPESLRRAALSALAQTDRDLAVIIVDDGGGLPGELPDDPRLSAISLRANTSDVGLVRNVGIHLTDSEYIAYLDDDNEWTPHHLSTALSVLDADAHLGAVYTALRRYRPDGTELDVLSTPFDRVLLRRMPFVDTNSIVVRRTANPDFSLVPRGKHTVPKEDWEYVWRLSRHSRIAHIPIPTVSYVLNPDSYYTDWNGPRDPLAPPEESASVR